MRAIVGTLTAAVLLAGCSTPASTPARQPTPTAGQSATSTATAPKTESLPDVTLAALDGGEPLKLAGLSGIPTVINLWASWCGPCKAELPLFARAHRELGDSVRVLGIDFADPAPEAARHLAARAGVTFPLYADPDSTVRADLKVIGLPQTVFVDGRGTVVATERRAFRSYADLSGALADHLRVKP